MNGILEKNGQSFNFSVADDASHDVQSPLSFTMQIGIKPAAKAVQSITLSRGDGKSAVKQWGVKEQ